MICLALRHSGPDGLSSGDSGWAEGLSRYSLRMRAARLGRRARLLVGSWPRRGIHCSRVARSEDPAEVAKFRTIDRALAGEGLVNDGDDQPLSGKKALDVGCGGGLLSESLARLGAEVMAVDASAENVALARGHAQQDPQTRGIEYSEETAEEVLGRGLRFNLVCSLEVVEHVPDARAFVSTLAGLTAPGGVVVLSTLNRTAVSKVLAIGLAEYVLGLVPVGTHEWDRFIAPADLSQMLSEHGFREVDRSGMIYNPLSNAWWLSESDLRTNYILAARKMA